MTKTMKNLCFMFIALCWNCKNISIVLNHKIEKKNYQQIVDVLHVQQHSGLGCYLVHCFDKDFFPNAISPLSSASCSL